MGATITGNCYMCKYLQNAPKTLANRRAAPPRVPWLIAIVVSVFCSYWNCNSFVSIFPAHTHTHINVVTHMRVDCAALFMPFDVLWLLPLSLSLLPQFSLHIHTQSHAQWFLLLLCCHFCCRDIVSNIVVAIVRQHQDCSCPLLRAHTKELHYLCM